MKKTALLLFILTIAAGANAQSDGYYLTIDDVARSEERRVG